MSSLLSAFAPSATTLIRFDHALVLTMFHQYDVRSSPRAKQALVDSICLLLEIHAQLEEEIFYPVMRSIDAQLVDRNLSEQHEWYGPIARLRAMSAAMPEYDATFLQLLRSVMKHVADEETIMLPDAQRVLDAGELGELGARMARRRFELVAQRGGEVIMNTARGLPASIITLLTGGALAAAYLALPALRPPAWMTLRSPKRDGAPQLDLERVQ